MFFVSHTGKNDDHLHAHVYYRIVFLILALACLVLQAAALGPLRDGFWGFHLYAFLPRVVFVAGWVSVTVGFAPPIALVATIAGRHNLITTS